MAVDYISVDTDGWFELNDADIPSSASDISGTYIQYPNIPNEYITKCKTSNYAGSVGSYNNEKQLFDLMVTEGYNKYGVSLDYYVTSFDNTYDKIWGEDNNRRFVRRFQIMGYFVLPREERIFTQFGIAGMDQFTINVSKKHYYEASQYDDIQTNPKAFQPYVPFAGDYIYSNYNKFIYEIVSVKDEAMMSLFSKQHSWEFLVRPYKDEKIQVSPLTSAAPIANQTNLKTDIFDTTTTINNAKPNILYQPGPTEKSSQDPFGNW